MYEKTNGILIPIPIFHIVGIPLFKIFQGKKFSLLTLSPDINTNPDIGVRHQDIPRSAVGTILGNPCSVKKNMVPSGSGDFSHHLHL